MVGKVVLITGASSGIGRACAERLAGRGWTVVGASRRTAPDAGWTSVTMDVDDDASVTDAVDRVVADHGGIDAVVTCAGWGLAGPVEDPPVVRAQAQLDTNFFGTVRVVVGALPSLRARMGRIVLVSSIGGVIGRRSRRTTRPASSLSRAGPRRWPGSSNPTACPSPWSNPATSAPASPAPAGPSMRPTGPTPRRRPRPSPPWSATRAGGRPDVRGPDVEKVLSVPSAPAPVGRSGWRARGSAGQTAPAQPAVRGRLGVESRRLRHR